MKPLCCLYNPLYTPSSPYYWRHLHIKYNNLNFSYSCTKYVCVCVIIVVYPWDCFLIAKINIWVLALGFFCKLFCYRDDILLCLIRIDSLTVYFCCVDFDFVSCIVQCSVAFSVLVTVHCTVLVTIYKLENIVYFI